MRIHAAVSVRIVADLVEAGGRAIGTRRIGTVIGVTDAVNVEGQPHTARWAFRVGRRYEDRIHDIEARGLSRREAEEAELDGPDVRTTNCRHPHRRPDGGDDNQTNGQRDKRERLRESVVCLHDVSPCGL